jgi:hypothetical protein
MPDLQKGVSRIKCDGSVLPFPKVERWNRYSTDPDPDFYGFSQSLSQNAGKEAALFHSLLNSAI